MKMWYLHLDSIEYLVGWAHALILKWNMLSRQPTIKSTEKYGKVKETVSTKMCSIIRCGDAQKLCFGCCSSFAFFVAVVVVPFFFFFVSLLTYPFRSLRWALKHEFKWFRWVTQSFPLQNRRLYLNKESIKWAKYWNQVANVLKIMKVILASVCVLGELFCMLFIHFCPISPPPHEKLLIHRGVHGVRVCNHTMNVHIHIHIYYHYAKRKYFIKSGIWPAPFAVAFIYYRLHKCMSNNQCENLGHFGNIFRSEDLSWPVASHRF